MRIVGIDLSLSSTGVALAVDGKLEYSRLVLGQGSGIPRLIAGRENVMIQIEEAKPDLILIEDLTYSLNKAYAKENAGFSYGIQMELVTDKIPYCVVSNSSLKKFCCGTAGSPKNPIKKERILKDVLRVFGHNIDSNDEADAIVLAYMGMALTGQWKPRNDPQRDSLVVIYKSNPWLKTMMVCKPCVSAKENPPADNRSGQPLLEQADPNEGEVESSEELDPMVSVDDATIDGW